MMGTAAKRITRNRILKGINKGKGGKGKVKRAKEEINDDEKSIQCSGAFPSDPAARSRKRTQKSVNKKMKVKKEFHNSNAQNAAAVGSETTVKKKAMLIAEFLDRIYPYPPVPLNHYDTFTLLVAVILSAQTTDGKVVSSRLFTLILFCIFLSNCCAHMLHLLLSTVSLLVSPKYRLML